MGWQSTVWAPTVWAAGVWVCDTATPTPRPYPGPAGRGKRQGKRKKWVIDGQQIIATPEEIEEYFEARLERERAPEREEAEEVEAAEVEAPKAPTRDRAIVSAFPTYPNLRDMLLAAKEIEAAQILRRVAKRLADEEDERDIEMLLLH